MILLDLQNLIIPLVLIVFTYFSWRKIEYGIYAVIFLLPVYLLRFAIFGIPTTVLEIGIYILFIIWLVKKILKNFKLCLKTKIHPNPPLQKEGNIIIFPPLKRGVKGDLSSGSLSLLKEEKTLFLGILLLMSGAAISTLLSSDLKTSAGILKGWFFDPFLFFIILISAIKNSSQIENVLKIFSVSGFAVAMVSLFYWLGFLPSGVSYDGRLYGFYASPNYLAMYLAIPLIIAVWLFLKLNNVFLRVIPSEARNPLGIKNSEYKRFLLAVEMTKYFFFLFQSSKIFWLILSIIISIPIYLTYSYATWFAIIVSVFLLIYLTASAEKRKIFFAAAFVILIVLFISQSGSSKFENLKNLSYRSSVNSRLMIWRSALMIGWDYPVLGIGPGNFQKYYLDYQKKFSEPYLEWAVPEPHNIFLAFWLGTGILGLIGFIMILVWFFRTGIIVLKKYRSNGIWNIAVVLLAAMVYILFHGLFDTTYWKNDLAVIFWLVLGLMVVIKKINAN